MMRLAILREVTPDCGRSTSPVSIVVAVAIGVVVPSAVSAFASDGFRATERAGSVEVLLSSISATEAEAHTARLWPSVVTEPLGRWTLRIDRRADAALLKRANSCLAMENPGCAVATALARVIDFYTSAGRLPLVQVRMGSEVERAVSAAGWTPVTGDSHFMAAPLELVRDLLPQPDDLVAVAAEDTHIAAIVEDDSATLARGSATADEAWLGIHALFVEPARRRRGLAQRVLAGILTHEAARVPTVGWLHVETDNDPAIALYRKLGFRVHHSCRYYEPGSGS